MEYKQCVVEYINHDFSMCQGTKSAVVAVLQSVPGIGERELHVGVKFHQKFMIHSSWWLSIESETAVCRKGGD